MKQKKKKQNYLCSMFTTNMVLKMSSKYAHKSNYKSLEGNYLKIKSKAY